MRGFGFSLLAVVMLAACGHKPEVRQASAPAIGQPLFLTFKSQTALRAPVSSIGTALRFAVAPNGDSYILDSDNHRVLRYSAAGTLYGQAGGLGTGPLQFNNPIDFDSDGLALWILDRQNQRLVRLDLALNYVEELSLEPDETDPTSVLWYDAITSAISGEIVLLDRAEPKALRITPAGDEITSYGGFGLGSGRMNDPTALTASHEGDLYVADGTRVLHYDRTGRLKHEAATPQPIKAIAAGAQSVWILTRSGKLYLLQNEQLLPAVVDPAAAIIDPVAIDVSRDGDLVVLDRELSVWLLSPPAP